VTISGYFLLLVVASINSQLMIDVDLGTINATAETQVPFPISIDFVLDKTSFKPAMEYCKA
jgi:hypothetical protein